MKMTLYQILMANNILDGVSLNSLNIEDAKCILDFRNKVATLIATFEEARKDASEKLKPEFTEDMNEETRQTLEAEWNSKVTAVLTEEVNKEIELDIKKASLDAKAKIHVNSKITMGELVTLSFLFV